MHDAVPEKPCPLNVTPIGWLYQPFESGGRSGTASAVGELTSMWSVVLSDRSTGPSHVAVHDRLVTVSVSYLCRTPSWQGGRVLSGGSEACQKTETGLVYHRN